MRARIARCEAKRLRKAFGDRNCSIDIAKTLTHNVSGPVGPGGISDTAADLLDVAAAIYRCERLLKSAGTTNRYTEYHLSLPLRNPKAWNARTISFLADTLEFLGNAKWTFDFAGAAAPIPAHDAGREQKGKVRIVLFSGGLDSTCGLAVQAKQSSEIVLNSYYTRQKTKQTQIASGLGYDAHIQWTLPPLSGPGRSFYYRSFYFLSLAAVVAQSWKIRRITQFETGVLAYAIPPSPWYAMTKHGHPTYLTLASQFYKELFGGNSWIIENPFISYTKRQEVHDASKRVGATEASKLFAKTETCWSHWACHVHGSAKDPGEPCGVCIPCIVRRTALPSDPFKIDLRIRRLQNHEKLGQAFRSYLAFVKTVLECRSADKFYTLLPGHVRQLVLTAQTHQLDEIYRLFVRFGNEFMETFF